MQPDAAAVGKVLVRSCSKGRRSRAGVSDDAARAMMQYLQNNNCICASQSQPAIFVYVSTTMRNYANGSQRGVCARPLICARAMITAEGRTLTYLRGLGMAVGSREEFEAADDVV